MLSMRNNSLIGDLPSSLQNCTLLQLLDVGENNLYGLIPVWIGKGLTELRVLSLPSNGFNGTLPPSFLNTVGLERARLTLSQDMYVFEALLLWKGRKLEYRNTLGLVTSLDLSSNMLNGEIPSEITRLTGLVALNLLRNNLTGHIPQDIGKLRWLDFLDVSRNHLGAL
ncbi:putative leucine-rich repeat protein [Tanacetum coccineum]